MANPNFDTILTTTMNKYRRRLEDNIFRANPLLYWLSTGGRINKEDGGAKLIVPVMGVKSTATGTYADYESLSTFVTNAQSTDFTAAEYAWRQFVGIVAISGIEEAKNNGVSKVIKLLDAKIQHAELSMSETMNQMLFLDGTGNSGKDFCGLAGIVSTADPAAGGCTAGGTGLGNIAVGTNAWWASVVDTTAEALTLSRMTNLYNSASKGNDHPDLVLSTQALFEKYEGLLQPQARYTDMKTADGGFQNLLFKGAVFMFDLYNQSAVIYFLNSKYLDLTGHTQVWFKNTPFIKRHDVDARYSQILAYGNLTCSNRARQAKGTGKTA